MTLDPLSRFEDHVQQLIEGGLARLLAGRLHVREVAIQLARCMEDRAIVDEAGRRFAPDVYSIRMNPDDHEFLLSAHPDLPALLAQELLQAAQADGLSLLRAAEVKLLADSTVAIHQVLVAAWHAHGDHDSTESLAGGAVWEMKKEDTPAARLILAENRVVTLDRPILNLGRQRDNHIILEGRGVSRHHAQIRLRFGHYTLFDLGSSAGTAVNGQPVREAVLHSGDVIHIGGQSLIYVEDSAPNSNPEQEDTRPLRLDPAS